MSTCAWCGAEFDADVFRGIRYDPENMPDPEWLEATYMVAVSNCADCVGGALVRAGLIAAAADQVH